MTSFNRIKERLGRTPIKQKYRDITWEWDSKQREKFVRASSVKLDTRADYVCEMSRKAPDIAVSA